MIADFGLSRVMAENKLSMLTEVCGTPGVSFSFPVPAQGFKRFGSTWRPKFSKRVRRCDSMSLTVILTLLLAGHGKPVDVWAMGVITYFLLAGAHTWHPCGDYGAESLVQVTPLSIATPNDKRWKPSLLEIINSSLVCYFHDSAIEATSHVYR